MQEVHEPTKKEDDAGLDDDDQEDADKEAVKKWAIGRSMGFLVDDDRELTKALVRIRKKNQWRKERAHRRKRGVT